MKNEQKIQKTDALRRQLNKSTKTLERVTDNWIKATQKAKTPIEMRKINKDFEKKYATADKQENKDYKKYYDFVHKNFDNEVVNKCVKGGVFNKKEFIDRLKKETKEA